MDNRSLEQNLGPVESEPFQSDTNAVAEDNCSPAVGSSEAAIMELRRIREQLNSHLDKISGDERKASTDPTQDASHSSIPTDSTSSDKAQDKCAANEPSIAVVFEGAKLTGEQASAQNLIPELHRKQAIKENSMWAAKGSASVGIHRNDTEAERLEKMRAAFDFMPTPKQTLAQIQKEYTENRIENNKKICELNAEVAVKVKESEFLELQLARSHTELRVAKSEIAMREAENKKLRQAMSDLESKTSSRILELTLELQQKASQLDTYERLYSQMDLLTCVDDGVLSGKRDDGNLSRMSAVLPGTFKYKLQQSLDLTQRLKDERDHLERCRDESDRKLKEAETKYQTVLIEMNKLKIGEDMKLTNTKASLQLKCFELQRVSLILEEYQEKYRAASNENEELKRKLETIGEELNAARCELNEETTRLTLELQSKSAKLELYEKIEDALDDMILKAATVPNADAAKHLLSFSGPSLPTDSRRRLQQAFDLAKKNCELEKTVAEQKKEILNLYDERQTLRHQLETIKSLSGYSVGQLVETITEKTREISKLNSRFGEMERDLSEAKQSKEILQQTVENLGIYHDQMHSVYRSGVRISDSKVDRLLSDSKIMPCGKNASNTAADGSQNDGMIRISSMHQASNSSKPCLKTYAPKRTTSTTRSHVSFASSEETVQTYPDTFISVTTTPDVSAHSLPVPVSKCPSRYETNDVHPELQTITEESDKETFEANSVLLESSSSSVTSSMFGPAPPMVRTRPPLIVSVRKIRPYRTSSEAKVSPFQSTSTSKMSLLSESSSTSTSKHAKGSKPIPGRKVVSVDLIAQHSQDTEKPVPLRLSKVKPSSSIYF